MRTNNPNERPMAIGPGFVQELNRRLQLITQGIEERVQRLEQYLTSLKEKDVRFGLSVSYDEGAEEEGGTYPDRTVSNNTFWVKLGAPSFTASQGDQTLTVTPYDPAEYRIVHSLTDSIPAQGDPVVMFLSHGQYFTFGIHIQTFITQIQVTSTKVQYKTRSGLGVGPESAWIDLPSVECVDLGP